MLLMFMYTHINNMQIGTQLIHQAALCGNTDALVMLIEQFGVDPQEKADVSHMKWCEYKPIA